jgi:hypothetical protein
VKFIATASTAYGLWQGSRWAKWLYVFGFTVGAGLLLYLAATVRPAVTPFPAAGGIVFGMLATLLASSPAVNQFMACQRGERVLGEFDDFVNEEVKKRHPQQRGCVRRAGTRRPASRCCSAASAGSGSGERSGDRIGLRK